MVEKSISGSGAKMPGGKSSAKSGESKKSGNGKTADSGLETMTEDVHGQKFIPGTAPIVVKELVDSVKRIEKTLKPGFGRARDALIGEQENLAYLCDKHAEHFVADADGNMIYHAGKVKITLPNVHAKPKTELDEE